MPGSIWAQLFYSPQQIARAQVRFDPATSHLEVLRNTLTDLLAGGHDNPTADQIVDHDEKRAIADKSASTITKHR